MPDVNDVPLTASMRSNLLLLQRTDAKISDTQNKLATGQKINTALDGPTEFFAAKGLTTRANDLNSLKDAMGQAVSTIRAADTGITSIESLIEQMRGLTTSALGSLGNDPAAITTRKTLAEQFNTLKDQIDKLAGDSGYQGKNLLVGNGLRIDSTSTSRATVNSITGISNARSTNVVSADTYSIRVQGDGALEGNASDLVNAEFERGFVGMKISGTMSSTLGSFGDVTLETRGATGRLRTFSITDGSESRSIQYFDNTQAADAALSQAASSGVGQTSTVTISGTVEEGDIYTVKIQGITLEYTAQSGDDTDAVATALAASVNSAITAGRLKASDFSSGAATVSSSGVITITGDALTTSANDFTINATTTNALSLTISESFASGSVVSFTVDRLAMEEAGNGVSTIEKNVNIQIEVTSLTGEVVTRDGTNERGQEKLAAGENSFAFDSGTVRLTVEESKIFQAASAQSARNLITTQQADANTQNDLTVVFNERNTNTITVLSQNVTTNGQGLQVDYAQNSWLDRADIEKAIDGLDHAREELRNASQALSTNLNVITTREDFTKEFSDVLVEGANKLTLADQNEEGTKLLMLQTRQQLGTISLSIANQQQQAILQLF